MPVTIKKSDLYASICTAVVCILILLILLLCGLSIYKEEMEEGIMVSFSEDYDGGGSPAPLEEVSEPLSESAPSAAAPAPQQATPAPPVITQQEPSAPIASSDKQMTKAEKERLERQRVIAERKAEEQRKAEEARKAAEAEAARKAAVAANASSRVTGAFGKGGTSTSSTGQGSTTGNTIAGNPLGHGSEGGNSWSLSGRNLRGEFVKPAYSKNQSGTVVVEIKVDAAGNVTSATILQNGTTITDTELRNAAKSAALKTKFTAGEAISIGRITYNFVLN